MPGFPGGSSATGVAGLVSDTLAACALGSCWSLTAGVWTSLASMGVARGNYSAASNSSEGWMVTGGLDITSEIPSEIPTEIPSEIPSDYSYEYNYRVVKNRYHLSSTEVFTNESWSQRSELLDFTWAHCQLQVAETVLVLGSTLL